MTNKTGKAFYIAFVLIAALAVYAYGDRQRGIDHKQLVQQQRSFQNALVAQEDKAEKKILEVQFQACTRGRVLRDRLNDGHEQIQKFMKIAIRSAEARKKLDTGAAKELDKKNIRLFTDALKHFKPVPQVNCYQAVYGITPRHKTQGDA